MAVKTLSYLKNTNRTFDNILDSMRQRVVLAKASSYTVTEDDARSNTLFTTSGSDGSSTVNFTLPAATTNMAGCEITIIKYTDAPVTCSAGTADTLISYGDRNADAIAIDSGSAGIGSSLKAFCDGTHWCATVDNAVSASAAVVSSTAYTLTT